MNWGRTSAQRLLPSQVVDLLLQNGIKHARIFTTEVDILGAFAGSGINLTMSVSDPTFFSANIDVARNWIKWKYVYFRPANVRLMILGETVFTKGLTNKSLIDKALKSLEYSQAALDDAGFDIKVTFTHNIQVLKPNITKPSEAEFMDEIKEQMITAVRFLEEHDSPFMLNMFPISDTIELHFDHSFAFPDNKSTHIVTDVNGAVYTNIFEFVYDSFIWALKKIDANKIHIMASQVGWPTDGYEGANVTAAESFFKSFLPMVVSNKGTPMRPGKPIDIFIHSLADEHKMPFFLSSPFTRHWGIYRSNGIAKYNIDLSGQGRDIRPTEVRGIMRMPQRWCMFNRDFANMTKVDNHFQNACSVADCTSMADGGSCSGLSPDQRISYAFNMVFQNYFQDEKVCDFDGLGYVSSEDPSTQECMFPVEVVKGQQTNYIPVSTATSLGKRLHPIPKTSIFLVFLLSVMATFIWD